MSGDSTLVWVCLIGGMLLQLTYMILPFQRWDWARYLGSAALPLLMFGRQPTDHTAVDPALGLFMCGTFTITFAFLFQDRLLPWLGEGVVLMWTVVLMCVVVELGAWGSPVACLALVTGFTVLGLLIVPPSLPYVLKLAVYVWFLFVVVTMSVLQFRASDLSLIMSGHTNNVDYRFALVDGVAGAYIGVHAAFLFEMLPIPGRGERWSAFKTRWFRYLDLAVSRFDDQRLDRRAALVLVLSIVSLAYVNHAFELIPDRTLVNLVLIGLPIAWQAVWFWRTRRQEESPSASAPIPPSNMAQTAPRVGIGRARHSRKHRQ